jgi:N-acetylglucosamine kinase-like BadF-type ATPase
MSRLFLGVDGGQTSTTALIGDESGSVLGFGKGGPCSYVRAPDGRERFAAAMRACLAAACARAGLDPGGTAFEAAVLGFSGGAVDRRPVIEELLQAERLVIASDVEVALTGALAGEPGIITIAGTGSASFGRNAAGTGWRAGGWGPLFGDEGAAFDLTRQALRAALRDHEGWGPPTLLHPRLLAATGAAHVHDLVRLFYTADFPAARIAGFARLVDEAAQEGDEVARGILDAAAAYLAQLTAVVRNRLFAGGTVRVAPVGGTFRLQALRDRFRSLVEADGCSTVVDARYGPAAGALLEAYAASGLRPALSNVPEAEK